jgi:hypothetical protein
VFRNCGTPYLFYSEWAWAFGSAELAKLSFSVSRNSGRVGSGIRSHHAVGLEGDEPALISYLGGNFLELQRIVCIIAVFEGFEISRDQHPRPHEPLGEDRKDLADFGMEFIPMKTDGLVPFLDSPIANVKILGKLNVIIESNDVRLTMKGGRGAARALSSGFHLPALIFFQIVCHIVIHRGLKAQEFILKPGLTQLL